MKKFLLALAMAERGLEEFAGEGDADLQIASQDFRRLEETRLKVTYLSACVHRTCSVLGKTLFSRQGMWKGLPLGRTSAFKLDSVKGLREEWLLLCTGGCSEGE